MVERMLGNPRVSLGGAALALCLSISGCTAEQEIRCGAGTELVAGDCVPAAPDDGGQVEEADGSMVGPSRRCGDSAFEVDGGCEGKRPIGAACQAGAQCASGTCLGEDRGATDGYCTVAPCSPNRPCPAGSRCYYSTTEEQFLCLVYCDDDADCRDGYACQPLYTTQASVCAPSCMLTGACPSGTQCQASSGKCVLHECVLGSSDACASDDDAGVSEGGAKICYADRLGISSTGAVCLPACDPGASQSPCASNEVCQPLPEDPESLGLCVPPLCSITADCSAGAECMDGVCQPPARCDAEGECGTEQLVCVGGPGGQCMPRCPQSGDDGCAALHPGLACSSALDACLPVGTFPGGVCRSDLNDPCSSLSLPGSTQADMVCEGGLCLVACGQGGSALCEGVSSTLTCAQGIFGAPLCLPKGSFPGGPCGAQDACAPLSHGGDDLPMICSPTDQCVVTCDASDGGDVLCASIDASLTCIANAFGGASGACLPRGSYPGGPCGPGDSCSQGMSCQDNRCLSTCATGGDALCAGISAGLACARAVYDVPVCLPYGTFPGSPCRSTLGAECDQNLGGLADADMVCVNGTCVVQCQLPGAFADGDALCSTVSPALTCLSGTSDPDVCVPNCSVGGQAVCDAISSGLACASGIDDESVCLPRGSFPGSPCGEENFCAQNLNGVDAVDMFCNAGTCVVGCESNNDALCGLVNSALTCLTRPGPNNDFCTLRCGGGNACPSGLSCLVSQDACLPTGTFPGSPCAGGTTCDEPAGLICVAGTSCGVACDAPPGPSQQCEALGSAIGATFDTCVDGDPGPTTTLICIQAPPPP